MVVMDYFTRWAESYAIPNQEAATVADKLISEFSLRFSPPLHQHTDHGRQFESALLWEVCSSLGINKTHTTPYHPQSDGFVEWFNSTLLSMLPIAAKDRPFTCDNYLLKLCMAYKTSVHAFTGYTPFFFMFGCEARPPVDIMFRSSPIKVVSPS